MYNFNVYEDFGNHEFKFLCTYACYGRDRAEAKTKALVWAQETYPDRNVSVMSTN